MKDLQERSQKSFVWEIDPCFSLNVFDRIFDGWDRNEIVHFKIFFLTYLKLCAFNDSSQVKQGGTKGDFSLVKGWGKKTHLFWI